MCQELLVHINLLEASLQPGLCFSNHNIAERVLCPAGHGI